MRRLLAVFLAILAGCAPQQTPTVDYLIVGGTVVDGSEQGGEPGRVVEVSDGRILYVGPDRNSRAREVIDATGMVVSPGFIDPHTHADADLRTANSASNAPYLYQGVTTVFIGNDGGGDAVADFKRQLQRHPLGTNVGLWSGHGRIRAEVMGHANRAPTPEELLEMQRLVRTDMAAGALGLSTGLFYAPGSYADTQEVVALAKVAALAGGVYETHLRDEGNYGIGLQAAVREAIEIGAKAHIPVHIAHIKALGPAVHGTSGQVIELIERARRNGQAITADQYPWLASGTRLSNALVPRRVMSGGRDAMRRALADAATVAELRDELANNLRRRGGAAAILITGDVPYRGQSLEELAATRGTDPISAAVAVILEGDPAIASFMMREDDLINFMRAPWVVTGSDGSHGHPRKYGTYPKKYRTFVAEREALSLVEFVHRSSGLTADTFGLCDRGYLRTGQAADIVVWDSSTYAATATYSAPRRLAEGVAHVFVNGLPAIMHGSLSKPTGGRVLKPCTQNQ